MIGLAEVLSLRVLIQRVVFLHLRSRRRANRYPYSSDILGASQNLTKPYWSLPRQCQELKFGIPTSGLGKPTTFQNILFFGVSASLLNGLSLSSFLA